MKTMTGSRGLSRHRFARLIQVRVSTREITSSSWTTCSVRSNSLRSSPKRMKSLHIIAFWLRSPITPSSAMSSSRYQKIRTCKVRKKYAGANSRHFLPMWSTSLARLSSTIPRVSLPVSSGVDTSFAIICPISWTQRIASTLMKYLNSSASFRPLLISFIMVAVPQCSDGTPSMEGSQRLGSTWISTVTSACWITRTIKFNHFLPLSGTTWRHRVLRRVHINSLQDSTSLMKTRKDTASVATLEALSMSWAKVNNLNLRTRNVSKLSTKHLKPSSVAKSTNSCFNSSACSQRMMLGALISPAVILSMAWLSGTSTRKIHSSANLKIFLRSSPYTILMIINAACASSGATEKASASRKTRKSAIGQRPQNKNSITRYLSPLRPRSHLNLILLIPSKHIASKTILLISNMTIVSWQ